MKKFFAMALVAVATIFGANAEETYAPQAGDFSVEIQFNPFSTDFETFKLDGLEGRYFFSNKDAVRIGLGFGVDSKKSNGSVDDSDIWKKARTSNFSLNLGYERHFFNYKRVDLYAGLGLGFSMNKVKETQNFGNDNKTETTNAGDTYNEFAAKVFTGIDFYVYKGLYVGAELGIKIGAKSFPGQVIKGGVNDAGVWSNSYEVSKSPKSSAFVLATYAEPALRLGWKF